MNEYELTSGESWTREVTVWTDENQTERFDLAGSSVTFKVYDAPGGELVWTGQAEIAEDTTSGEITVALAGAQTATKPLAVLYWVVRVELSGDRVFDADSGKLRITP